MQDEKRKSCLDSIISSFGMCRGWVDLVFGLDEAAWHIRDVNVEGSAANMAGESVLKGRLRLRSWHVRSTEVYKEPCLS